jgi:F0F1-type ATP synthase membrane subunit c/vacuolar-type H+-ATPase subunit K
VISLVHAVVVVLVGLLQMVLGGVVVQFVFSVVDRRTPPALVDGEAPDSGAGSIEAAARQLRGGAWIGVLERLAIYATLLAGYPEGIAVALAVKGLARYPELKSTSTGTAERFIIGTFTSVLLAAGAAGLARALVSVL